MPRSSTGAGTSNITMSSTWSATTAFISRARTARAHSSIRRRITASCDSFAVMTALLVHPRPRTVETLSNLQRLEKMPGPSRDRAWPHWPRLQAISDRVATVPGKQAISSSPSPHPTARPSLPALLPPACGPSPPACARYRQNASRTSRWRRVAPSRDWRRHGAPD
jgi:hypothetical protein